MRHEINGIKNTFLHKLYNFFQLKGKLSKN